MPIFGGFMANRMGQKPMPIPGGRGGVTGGVNRPMPPPNKMAPKQGLGPRAPRAGRGLIPPTPRAGRGLPQAQRQPPPMAQQLPVMDNPDAPMRQPGYKLPSPEEMQHLMGGGSIWDMMQRGIGGGIRPQVQGPNGESPSQRYRSQVGGSPWGPMVGAIGGMFGGGGNNPGIGPGMGMKQRLMQQKMQQ